MTQPRREPKVDARTSGRVVAELYEELIAGWNGRDAARLAAPFAEDGAVIREVAQRT